MGCGRGDDSTPFFPDKKLRPTVLVWGPRRRKNANGLPRGCPKSRTIRRGSRGLPHFSISHSQLAAFAIETVLPPSSAPRFRQCTLGNAVYLSLPVRCMSPLCVLEGLSSRRLCKNSGWSLGDVVLEERLRNPAGGA